MDDRLLNAVIDDVQHNLDKLRDIKKNCKNESEWLRLKDWIKEDIDSLLQDAHFKLYTFNDSE